MWSTTELTIALYNLSFRLKLKSGYRNTGDLTLADLHSGTQIAIHGSRIYPWYVMLDRVKD